MNGRPAAHLTGKARPLRASRASQPAWMIPSTSWPAAALEPFTCSAAGHRRLQGLAIGLYMKGGVAGGLRRRESSDSASLPPEQDYTLGMGWEGKGREDGYLHHAHDSHS